jgi:hypothetical protein
LKVRTKIKESWVKLFKLSTPFRSGLRSPSSWTATPLKMGEKYCAEISVTMYKPGARSIPEECRPPNRTVTKTKILTMDENFQAFDPVQVRSSLSFFMDCYTLEDGREILCRNLCDYVQTRGTQHPRRMTTPEQNSNKNQDLNDG